MAGERADERGRNKRGAPSTPWLERVGAGTGLVLTLGLFGAIGWGALDGAGGSPVIVVEVGGVTRIEGGYRVEVRVRNRSGAAAAQVEVEGRLAANPEGEPETGRMTFDYVAGRSSRSGGLFFTRDPRSGSLAVRPTAYVTP